MKISWITLKGYKSIRELELELGAINVLIGANGSGKTNFISVFKLLNQILSKNLQTFIGKSGGADTLLHFGSKNTEKIEIAIKFGQNTYQCELIPTQDDKLIFELEETLFQGEGYDIPFSNILGIGNKETKLHLYKDLTVIYHVIEGMKSWQVYHFHDTSDSAKVKKTCNINDNEYFRSDASNLAAFLYFLQENYQNNYDTIVETIKLVAPFFKNFRLRPDSLNTDKIRLEWSHVGSGDYFNVSSFSDGTLRFICLATLFLQPDPPTTIILDEPELGLHPYAISLLSDLIRSASVDCQVIISTQSVTLVNQFTPSDIIVVDRENGISTFKRPSEDEIKNWLDDYSIGELWEKNILGGRPQ